MDEMSASSLISLRSISDATGLDSERQKSVQRSSTGTKRIKKTGTSPYGTSKALPKKTPKRTGREIWVEAVQYGGGISAEGRGISTWRNGKPRNLNNASTATPFLKEQLTSGSPLPSKPSRPSSSASRVGGTGPVYKDAESYYDDIQALKRQLKQVQYENSEVKAKNIRMEDELIAKSRKIDELLNPELQSNDIRRTLTTKKPTGSEVVMSLRRKIYKLEENLRDKEASMRKMKSDIKQTNVEELIIENQICLYEIQRLTQVLKETKAQYSQNAISEDLINDAMKDTKGKKSQVLLKRLTEDNHGLVLENKSLKNDLMKLTRGNEGELNISKDYEDMNRNELLQKISSLEQCLKMEEKRVLRDVTTEEAVDKETIDDNCIELKGPLPQQVKQLRAREKELLTQIDSMETTVKKLKDDRSHYRKTIDEYRQKLENAQKKPDDIASDTASIKSDKATKNRVRASSPGSRKFKVKEDKVADVQIEDLQEAKIPHRSKGKLQDTSDDDEFENAIISIQSSWRGHKARESYIDSVRESEFNSRVERLSFDEEELGDDDVELIQAALRGHSTRRQLLQKSKRRSSSLSNKSVVANLQDERPPLLLSEQEETDEDDDVVIGSDASLARFRPPSHVGSLRNESARNSISYSSSRSPASPYNDAILRNRGIENEERRDSVKSLKSSSSPWPESIHEMLGSEEEDVVTSSNKKRKMSKKAQEKLSKKSDDENDLTNRWANSGTKDRGEQASFEKRLNLRKSSQLLRGASSRR